MRKTLSTLALAGAILGLAPAIPAQAAPVPGCHAITWGQVPAKKWAWYQFHGWHGVPWDGQTTLYSPGCFV